MASVPVCAPVTVTVVDSVPFGLAVCLAVTVQDSVTVGAVYSPALLMVPHEAVHVTAVVAENCTVPPSATVGLVGDIEKLATPPVPERDTVWGLLVAVSVNDSVAARAPEAEGLNTMLAVHVPTGARLVPQVLLEMEKSAEFVPLMAMLLIVTVVLPPLYREAACAALLVPTPTVPNGSDEGLAVNTLVADVPVPESVTVW